MLLHTLLNLIPFYLLHTAPVVVFEQGTQTPERVLNDATDAFINNLLAGYNSPGGVAVAVVRKDNTGAWNVETKGYGVATLANETRVTEHTLFAIGSNSKLFDALATGLLINNVTLSPRLSWTLKLASVIPGWGLVDPIAEKQVTIIDAMSHRTGLPRHDFSYRWSDNVPSVINKLKSQRPSAEFREVFQYNNNAYTVLSYLPTILLPSKIPFARYVKQHIFEPLGLTSTTYSYDVAKLGHLADGMTRRNLNISENPFGGIPAALPFWSTRGGEDGNILSGAGGVISNAVDMAVWLQTLLLNGVKPGTNDSIIAADIIGKVSMGVTVASPRALSPEFSASVYGGGQIRSTYRGHEVVEHDGGTPGFWSRISRLPFDNLGVAILCNDYEYGGTLTEIIKFRLFEEALGLDPTDWEGRVKPAFSILPPLATSRPVNATSPSAQFTSLAGVYNSGGYGKVEFCYVSMDYPAASRSCKTLTANISTILPSAVDPKIPTLIGVWDSPWLSHARLSHFSGDLFNISALNSLPTNDPSAPFWVSGGDMKFASPATAEFVVKGREIGLSIKGLWGAGAGIPSPQGQTSRDRAEVWFDKS